MLVVRYCSLQPAKMPTFWGVCGVLQVNLVKTAFKIAICQSRSLSRKLLNQQFVDPATVQIDDLDPPA
jgi:hypothetical protein